MSQDELLDILTNPIFKICPTSLLSLSFEGVGFLTKGSLKGINMDDTRAILEARNLLR